LDEPVGPVEDEQATDPPPGGVTAQVRVPVGVAPPVGPATVAVKVSVLPLTTPELFVTLTSGVTGKWKIQVSLRSPASPSPPKSTSCPVPVS
jgi:hypothetical protein